MTEIRRNPRHLYERDYQRLLAQHLMARGWHVQMEHPVEGGRVDLLAMRRGVERLIEVKVTLDRPADAGRVAGQLLRYAASLPGALLYVATPKPISPGCADVLRGYGIHRYKIDCVWSGNAYELAPAARWSPPVARPACSVRTRVGELARLRGFKNANKLGLATGLPACTAARVFNDRGDGLSLKTMDILCEVLDCEPADLFVKGANDN